MKKLPPSSGTAFISRPWLAVLFLFAAQHLTTANSGAETQYRFDADDTTVILKNYPNLTENLVSGGTNGVAATGNRIRLEGNGNLYVGVMGDPTIAGSGFESMEMDGAEWRVGGSVTLTGTSATTFHVKSGTLTIGGVLADMGSVVAANGDGPKATIDAGATLVVGISGSAGNLSVGGVVNNGSLVFARNRFTFDDTISGSGRVIQSYSTLTLTGTNTYSGGTYINSGTIIVTNGSALGTGKVDFLTAYCSLAMQLTTPADIVFNNELTGNGRIYVNLGSGTNVFGFGEDVGSQFGGTLYLQQGILDLGGYAMASTLANSSLNVSATSATAAVTILVGSGTKNIGSLVLGNTTNANRNAGALVFGVDISSPQAPEGDSQLNVGDFALVSTGTYGVSGTIRLAATTGSPLTTPVLPASSLFEQDDANIIAKLVDASGSVAVNASNLTLTDANNAVITNAQTRDVVQGTSGTVATATYDYRLTTGPDNDGLYVNYGLTNLNILSGKTLDLTNSGTGTTADNTLGAKLTGSGNFSINATGTMWLNGVGSTYTGATVVNSGVVIAGENRAFGNTASTQIKSGASVDMNGRLLAVGQQLVIEDGARLNLNGGYLLLAVTATSADSSIAANGISGGGTFRITIPTSGTSDVIFEGDNPNFSGTMSVANQSTNGSQIVLKTADALGAGTIYAGYGGSFVYQNVSGTMRTHSLNNSGYVIFESSTLFMTGTTRANTNLVDSDVTLGPTAHLAGSGIITIDQNSTIRIGMTSDARVTASTPLVFNGGTLDFLPPTRTETPRITINDLSGSGAIWVNANPNTGDSNIITFKRSSGNFDLNVRFVEEARTSEQAMPIYAISGTEANATITLANGQVESGVYVFKLVQGTGDSILMPDTGMWYLAADEGKVSRAAKAIASTAAIAGAEWHYSLDSVSKRMGDLRQEFRSGAKTPKGNLWMRGGNQSISAKESLCGAAFDEDVWVINAGVDKAFRFSSATAFVGLFGGAGRVDRTFTNLGDGSSDAVSVGLYATLLTDSGWFIDVAGKQDMIRNKFGAVSSDGSRINADYDGEVSGASVEIGRQIYLGKNKVRRWWIEPGLQAARAVLKSDDYVTDSGISVQVKSGNSQQYRAQLRFGYHDKGARFLPYGKIAGVYTTSSGSEIVADGRELQADFDGMRIEAGVGASYIINRENQVYFEYEYASADTYRRKWSVNVGYRHAW